jgi:hypothetical protein
LVASKMLPAVCFQSLEKTEWWCDKHMFFHWDWKHHQPASGLPGVFFF